MESKTSPVFATAIRTTHDTLIVVTEGRTVSIPWAECSRRLAGATPVERSRAVLTPSGYGIHWPLLDEDLAVGPLVRRFSSS